VDRIVEDSFASPTRTFVYQLLVPALRGLTPGTLALIQYNRILVRFLISRPKHVILIFDADCKHGAKPSLEFPQRDTVHSPITGGVERIRMFNSATLLQASYSIERDFLTIQTLLGGLY
jgi:hypothetical protein